MWLGLVKKKWTCREAFVEGSPSEEDAIAGIGMRSGE